MSAFIMIIIIIFIKRYQKNIARCQRLCQGFPFPQLSTNLRPQPLPIYSQVDKLFTTTAPFKGVIAESRSHAKAFEQMAATKR